MNDGGEVVCAPGVCVCVKGNSVELQYDDVCVFECMSSLMESVLNCPEGYCF